MYSCLVAAHPQLVTALSASKVNKSIHPLQLRRLQLAIHQPPISQSVDGDPATYEKSEKGKKQKGKVLGRETQKEK